jgi:broad specificity phosphatase PhoE
MDGRPETTFPGGEDLFMVRERMRSGLEAILDGKSGQTIMIVTHIGLLMATIRDLCPEVDMAEIVQKESQNCAVTEVDLRQVDGRWVGELLRWSDFSHLHGEATRFTPPLVHVRE